MCSEKKGGKKVWRIVKGPVLLDETGMAERNGLMDNLEDLEYWITILQKIRKS